MEKAARSRPDLQRKLDVLNNLISVNLTKLKQQTEEAEQAQDTRRISYSLFLALKASEDLEKEILGLEAILPGFKRELEKKS